MDCGRGLWRRDTCVCTETGDVYAVGGEYGEGGRIYTYDGASLTEMEIDPVPQLEAVFGLGTDDVFAAGEEGIILHYDGEEWIAQPTDTIETLSLLSANANGDLFAASVNGTVLSYDSGTWKVVEEGRHCVRVEDIWGTAENDVFASCSGGGILHYDGSVWQTMDHITTKRLTTIAGCGPDDVYASGTDYMHDWAVLHYDGNTWAHLDDFPDGGVGAFYCAGPDDLFARAGDRIARFDGSSWTTTESGLDKLRDIQGFGPDEVFVVGTVASSYQMAILYYDGVN